MKLSVIIVSYNVKYFLEQCLCSVRKAMVLSGEALAAGPETEVIVVDNASTDGSVAYLRSRFPFVRFIENSQNPGFGSACNQGLRQAAGEYILFLNPDTIVPESCFRDTLAFLESRADAGALGIRMIDGSGRYLKESKRGFPSPWVAFCKMSGLTAVFPRSRRLARYYLGHTSEHETQPAEALAGAFMLVRKDVLAITGGFDEQFFMYAEDIDLSYRIRQAGYQNYYFAGRSIVHFKGESTRKDMRYVKLFYKAMRQFVRKHYGGGASFFFRILLEIAIWLRAGMAALVRLWGKPAEPAGEAAALQAVLTGDPGSCRELQGFGDLSGAADTVIFCEGPAFSFEQLIAALPFAEKKILVHALGSHSIAGSPSREGKGIAIPVEPA